VCLRGSRRSDAGALPGLGNTISLLLARGRSERKNSSPAAHVFLGEGKERGWPMPIIVANDDQVSGAPHPSVPRVGAGGRGEPAIPRSEEDVAFAQEVADVLVNPEGKETTGGEQFFEDSMRALLTGVILYARYTTASTRASAPTAACRWPIELSS
jgi:hypothetical protein